MCLLMKFQVLATVTIFLFGIPLSCAIIIIGGILSILGAVCGILCCPVTILVMPCYLLIETIFVTLFCGGLMSIYMLIPTWTFLCCTPMVWLDVFPLYTISYQQIFMVIFSIKIVIILTWTTFAVILSGSPGYICICIAIPLLIMMAVLVMVAMMVWIFVLIIIILFIMLIIIIAIIGFIAAIGGGVPVE